MLEGEVSVYSIKLWDLSLLSNYVREARESTTTVGNLLVNCNRVTLAFPSPLHIRAPNGSLILHPLTLHYMIIAGFNLYIC